MNEYLHRNAHMQWPYAYEEAVDIYENGPFELIMIDKNGARWSYYDMDKTLRKLPSGDNITEDEYRHEFGIRLYQAMTRRCVSQIELSEMTGIGRITINRYINYKVTPSLYNADKIAKALKVSINELIYKPV